VWKDPNQDKSAIFLKKPKKEIKKKDPKKVKPKEKKKRKPRNRPWL